MRYTAKLTDTFGGEANYAWIRRASLPVDENITDSVLRRRAKAAVGLSGLRGRWSEYGDTLEFRPFKACVVLFVAPEEPNA